MICRMSRLAEAMLALSHDNATLVKQSRRLGEAPTGC
jgi:hypothetical protein